MPESCWSEEELVLLIEDVEFITGIDPVEETGPSGGLSSKKSSKLLSRMTAVAPDRDMGRPLPRPVTDPPSRTMVTRLMMQRCPVDPVDVQLAVRDGRDE